jgi:hypothetical protein
LPLPEKWEKMNSTILSVPPPANPLVDWHRTRSRESGRVHILYGTPSFRRTLLNQYLEEHDDLFIGEDWTSEGVIAAMTRAFRGLRVKHDAQFRIPLPDDTWELLWGLICVDTFLLEEPYRSFVDDSYHLISDVFRIIMEGRFLARESKPKAVRFLGTVVRWLTGQTLDETDRETLKRLKVARRVEMIPQRMEALCFLLVLAEQNELLPRFGFYLDGFEAVINNEDPMRLEELHALVTIVDRWAKLGLFPMSIILGWSGTTADQNTLRKNHPRLWTILQRSNGCKP